MAMDHTRIRHLRRGMYFSAVISTLWLFCLWYFAATGQLWLGILTVCMLSVPSVVYPYSVKHETAPAKDGRVLQALSLLLKTALCVVLVSWLIQSETLQASVREVITQAGDFNPYLVAMALLYTLFLGVKNVTQVRQTTDAEIAEFYQHYVPKNLAILFRSMTRMFTPKA